MTTSLVLVACTLIPWLFMALERDDVEASESTLMLSVARQLTHGPGELYGPYGGSNPLVLIHPPLYYRLAALCAWPIMCAGTDAETAARLAGCALCRSWGGRRCSLGHLFWCASWSTPRIAGWWAVLLAAATPVYGGLPFEVRPDMVGIAFQTWGVILAFKALLVEWPPETRKMQSELLTGVWRKARRPADRRMIVLAFVCFALAGCVKQHFVMASGVAFFLLMGARAQGRLDWKTLAVAILVEATILFAYYGFEEWLTAGRMSRSMLAAKDAAVIQPSTWQSAGEFMLVLCWKCVGPILLLAAAAVAAARADLWRRLLSSGGAVIIALVAALKLVQIFVGTSSISSLIVLGLVVTMVCVAPAALARVFRAEEGTVIIAIVAALVLVQVFVVTPLISSLIVLELVVTMACFAPAGAAALARGFRAEEIDLALAIYLVGELALDGLSRSPEHGGVVQLRRPGNVLRGGPGGGRLREPPNGGCRCEPLSQSCWRLSRCRLSC